MGQIPPKSWSSGIHYSGSAAADPLVLSVFSTRLGWFGLLGDGRNVTTLQIGADSPASLRQAVRHGRLPGSSSQKQADAKTIGETDWHPELRRELCRYAEGERVDLNRFAVLLPPVSTFQRRVLAATRQIGYGEQVTYGQLAAAVGSPRSARAVGRVMAANPVPLLIPCHRVVGAGGRLGGYSAPQGVDLKKRLLAMEAESSR